MEIKNNIGFYKLSSFLLLIVVVCIIGKEYLITAPNDEARLVHKDDISVQAALKSLGTGIKAMKHELDQEKLGVMVDKIDLTLNLTANQTEDGQTKLGIAIEDLSDMGVNVNKATNDNRNSSITISFKSIAQHDLDMIQAIKGMTSDELKVLGLVKNNEGSVETVSGNKLSDVTNYPHVLSINPYIQTQPQVYVPSILLNEPEKE